MIVLIKKINNLYLKYKHIVNYLFFGVLSTLINLVIYYVLTITILNPKNAIHLQIANIVSWIGAVIFAYITNRKYVFESKNKKILKEFTSFFGARIITLLMDIVIMFIGVTLLKQDDKIFKIISQVVVIVSNYIFSKIFVFKKEA